MVNKNSVYYEIKQQMKEKNKRHNDSWLLLIVIILILPIFLFFFAKKPYEYVSNLDNLPEPKQTPTTWWIVKSINWENVHIDFLAEYEIMWRVLAKKSYVEILADNKIINKIWPRDFTIWWWAFSKKENMDLMKRIEYGNRFVQPVIKEYSDKYFDWFNREFSGDYKHGDFWTLGINFSHNHTIWSDEKIRLLLKRIRVWDVIKIKWYLVYVHPEQWNWWRWPSSLTRTDSWDGACEIIYITDIYWLKEK